MPFRYRRRVQFAETDLAGVVHFSWMFRYMEEAEHALWRAAGLTIAEREGELGWPRVSASFTFERPLYFEDQFEVVVRLIEARTRSLRYAHTIERGDTTIGSGTMVVVCARRTGEGFQTVDVPREVVGRLQGVLEAGGGEQGLQPG